MKNMEQRKTTAEGVAGKIGTIGCSAGLPDTAKSSVRRTGTVDCNAEQACMTGGRPGRPGKVVWKTGRLVVAAMLACALILSGISGLAPLPADTGKSASAQEKAVANISAPPQTQAQMQAQVHAQCDSAQTVTESFAGLLANAMSAQQGDIFAYADTITTPAINTAPAIDIATATVKDIPPAKYIGAARTPKPVVTLGGSVLKNGRDYTLKYKDNKLPGTATVTITGVAPAYTGQKVCSFTIALDSPKKLKYSVDKTYKKNIQIKWDKADYASGYIVAYARNSKFTKELRKKTVKGAATRSLAIENPYYKRDYYVKVRAYKVIKGKTYYSEYSPVMKFKTKDLKWIEIDISKQKTYLHKGKKTVHKYLISSGKAVTPTHLGTYYVYNKLKIRDMHGWDPVKKAWYDTKGVRWVAYFNGGEAFHACTWHSNWGHPMSHGCINMRMGDAKQLYKWTPIGTKVEIHK